MDNQTITSFDTIQRISLSHKDIMTVVEVSKIIRCKSDNSYTEFFISDNHPKKKICYKLVVSKGLYHFEDILMSTGWFYRIHNQHIINVNYIKAIIRKSNGIVVMDDNTSELLPIARARKEEFLNYLKLKGIIL